MTATVLFTRRQGMVRCLMIPSETRLLIKDKLDRISLDAGGGLPGCCFSLARFALPCSLCALMPFNFGISEVRKFASFVRHAIDRRRSFASVPGVRGLGQSGGFLQPESNAS